MRQSEQREDSNGGWRRIGGWLGEWVGEWVYNGMEDEWKGRRRAGHVVSRMSYIQVYIYDVNITIDHVLKLNWQ